MLVIASKVTEGFTINGSIDVKVLGFHGSNVRLGITAPSKFSIRRKLFEPKPDSGNST